LIQAFKKLLDAVYLARGIDVSQEAALKHILKFPPLNSQKKVLIARQVSNMDMQK
jgi:hypothetical protein